VFLLLHNICMFLQFFCKNLIQLSFFLRNFIYFLPFIKKCERVIYWKKQISRKFSKQKTFPSIYILLQLLFWPKIYRAENFERKIFWIRQSCEQICCVWGKKQLLCKETNFRNFDGLLFAGYLFGMIYFIGHKGCSAIPGVQEQTMCTALNGQWP